MPTFDVERQEDDLRWIWTFNYQVNSMANGQLVLGGYVEQRRDVDGWSVLAFWAPYRKYHPQKLTWGEFEVPAGVRAEAVAHAGRFTNDSFAVYLPELNPKLRQILRRRRIAALNDAHPDWSARRIAEEMGGLKAGTIAWSLRCMGRTAPPDPRSRPSVTRPRRPSPPRRGTRGRRILDALIEDFEMTDADIAVNLCVSLRAVRKIRELWFDEDGVFWPKPKRAKAPPRPLIAIVA